MRPDRLALVGAHPQRRHLALARVDVEVVEPEIDQHFLQLGGTGNGPHQPQVLRLRQHLAALAPECLQCGAIARGAASLLGTQARVQRRRRFGDTRLRGNVAAQGFGLGDPLGMQLLVDPLSRADLLHALQITRRGAEREAVEQMPRVGLGHRRRQRIGRGRGFADHSGLQHPHHRQRRYHGPRRDRPSLQEPALAAGVAQRGQRAAPQRIGHRQTSRPDRACRNRKWRRGKSVARGVVDRPKLVTFIDVVGSGGPSRMRYRFHKPLHKPTRSDP